MAQSKEEIRARKQRWYAANFEKEMARMKLHRLANTERITATNRARYAKDPERFNLQCQQWRARNPEYEQQRYAADPEAQRKRNEEYRAANVERLKEYSKEYYSENAEMRRANTRKWSAENPEKVKANTQRRRVRRKNAEGSHTLAEWRALVNTFGGHCLCCKKHVGIRALTKDHVIPLTRGG